MTTDNFKKYTLLGLDCSSCANKIEMRLKKHKEFKNVSLDFFSKTLRLQSDLNIESTLKIISKVIQDIEPDVIIKEEEILNSSNFQLPRKRIILLLIGIILLLIAIIFNLPFEIEFILFFISYLFVGYKVIIKAIRNILKGRVFDENFLMTVATLGAILLKEFPEAITVMVFYEIGELFQIYAVNNSRKSIKSLMNIRPDIARLKKADILEEVSPEKVGVGDIIFVKPGERIPLDGIIIDGNSTLDLSYLTGESLPKEVEKGQDVLSGVINLTGPLTIKVTKEYSQSTLSKILELTQNASANKAKTEKFITKFAKYYTPLVLIASILIAIIPPLLFENELSSDWVYRALVFLVVSCPCALVISIPLGFFGGIGVASKNGILIKGGNFLEALNRIDTIVLDKTGTVTKGRFDITEIISFSKYKYDDLLKFAAIAESFSIHPIAKAISRRYLKAINKDNMSKYKDFSGHGIKVTFENQEILVGNEKLLKKEGVDVKSIQTIGTTIHIALDKEHIGYIVLKDVVKDEAKETIVKLKDLGTRTIAMLTGDSKDISEEIAKNLNIDKVFSGLLPEDKVNKFADLKKEEERNGCLVFVGDGINDAPVLAISDVGIAMGGLGSDAAIEASDIVIMNDDLAKIPLAIKIAKKTRIVVWQNIYFAFIVKGLVLILGAGGLAGMWEAIFADVGVAVLAILNSLRLLNRKF